MRASFPNKLIDLMSQSQHYEHHRRKIESIMNKQMNPSNIKRSQTLVSLQNFKIKAVNHSIRQKQSSIQRDNDLIFQKILKVNQRKNQSLMPINVSRSFSHKNQLNARKTIDSINNENNLIAQKLVTARSNLSQQKLGQSYKRHIQVKQRLKKYYFDEDFGVLPKSLKSMQRLKQNSKRRQYNGINSRYRHQQSIDQNQER